MIRDAGTGPVRPSATSLAVISQVAHPAKDRSRLTQETIPAAHPAWWYRGVVISHFTRDGARVTESDALGRALKAERVSYQIRRESDGRLKVLEVPTGVFVSYSYMGNDDRFGTPTLINGG